EGCVIHMFPGTTVHLAEGAHVGHGAMVHGATLGKNCMIGMNAVILDDAVIGEECIVGALALVKARSVFEPRSLVVGHPAEVKGQVSDAMVAHKTEGTDLYQRLPADCHDSMVEVEALAEAPQDRVEDFPSFETWQKRKAKTS
ncbi:MAG: gamma carbonic anhydrase family protein, partial [Bacteroidota bacterium]|nr:gamma carbonic anhydrase family protein [Bacteroidota bacterium]